MKCLIINYNRLTLLKAMVDWLVPRGLEVIIIDNHSDYKPLSHYYNYLRRNNGFRVLQMSYNYGHTVVWSQNIIKRLGITGRYIVSDPDLDLTGVPDDFLSVLSAGLDRYPAVDKCALSLEINDLPNTKEGNFIRGREARYWKNPLNNMYFYADTDTTFAMYREGVTKYSHSAIRTNRPYTCKHVSWYYDKFEELAEDEKNYYLTANDSSSGKLRLLS